MNGKEKDCEREIVDKARRLFAESAMGLDGQTRSKLAQARAKAVEAAGARKGRWFPAPSTLVPVGGVAAAALALALIWQGPGLQSDSMETAVLSDLDILLEGEELDLFEELDFYAWLLEQPELLEDDASLDGSG